MKELLGKVQQVQEVDEKTIHMQYLGKEEVGTIDKKISIIVKAKVQRLKYIDRVTGEEVQKEKYSEYDLVYDIHAMEEEIRKVMFLEIEKIGKTGKIVRTGGSAPIGFPNVVYTGSAGT